MTGPRAPIGPEESVRLASAASVTASHDVDRLQAALGGRYVIERTIGAGGMAVVYRATDVRHGRIVAMKVLRAEIAASIGRDRFLREIRILSSLAHPHILPLLDSGEADGFFYYTMPLVEESLRDRLERQTFLPLEEALRFAADVGEALDFAHARGIVHRDVKPANILLEEGHAIVADFSIAKALGDATSDTGRFIALGTAAYMSPEQGDAAPNIDGRSDVYALACVVYEMLAGSPPFSGPTPEAIRARKTLESMPSLQTVRPTIPSGLEDALRKALAVIPADRFATAAELVGALRAPPTRRSRRWIHAAGVAAVAVVIVLAYARMHPTPTSTGTRVAVAEFTNRTGEASLDNVGFMALDYITSGLERLPSLSVVPMPAAIEASRVAGNATRGTSPTALAGFGRETGADVIVSGSYYRHDDTLTFQTQVIDARDGTLRIAIGPVTAPAAHPEVAVVEIRTRAMGYFASTSDDRLAGRNEAKDTPPTYEAYSDFSAGMSAYLHSEFSTAVTKFTAAAARDSTFATPRLFASISLSNLGRYAESDSAAQSLVRMRDRLNPYYQDWLDYRLALLAGERPKALVAVRRLAGRAPGTKATFNLALEAQENGYIDEGLRAIRSLSPDRGAMRGWVTYWDELGSLNHLKGDYNAELNAGVRARAMYPDRLYALLPSVRALAALGRDADVSSLLVDAARMKDDQNGTTLGSLLWEAGDELRAHGRPAPADSLFAQASRWYAKRLDSSHSSRPDSLSLANVLYALGRDAEAASLLSETSGDIETLSLRGLIAAHSHRVDDARSTMARLAESRRPYQFGASEIARARIAALLGDSTEALSALREAFASGKEYDLWIHRMPEFASLRSNPAFIAMVRPRT